MRFALFVIALCAAVSAAIVLSGQSATAQGGDMAREKPAGLPKATLAGGCFWCLESEFRGFEGVVYTVVGYTGGHIENPTYKQVTSGTTGHAEAVEIYYDPAKTSYRKLVEHFLTKAHDPTQLNRQWVDEGPQYRSAIFYHDEEQKKIAGELVAALTAAKRFKDPIVTEISPAATFWVAEEYHQQYYEKYEAENGQPHIRVWLKQQNKKK